MRGIWISESIQGWFFRHLPDGWVFSIKAASCHCLPALCRRLQAEGAYFPSLLVKRVISKHHGAFVINACWNPIWCSDVPFKKRALCLEREETNRHEPKSFNGTFRFLVNKLHLFLTKVKDNYTSYEDLKFFHRLSYEINFIAEVPLSPQGSSVSSKYNQSQKILNSIEIFVWDRPWRS